MRSIGIVAVAACLALGSCANMQKVYDAVTEAKVPVKTVLVAESAFNIAKSTATQYITYCTPNPAPTGCDDALIKVKLIPAIKAGTDARNSLQAFLVAHPGELGNKGVYDALIAATTTIQTVVASYKGN
jgi:hypothetical protein